MSKLRGPLFSFSASGTLGKKLTYRGNIKRSVVSFYKTHFDRKSNRQQAHREVFSACRQLWKNLPVAHKQAWKDLNADYPGTGYSYFMSVNIRRTESGGPHVAVPRDRGFCQFGEYKFGEFKFNGGYVIE